MGARSLAGARAEVVVPSLAARGVVLSRQALPPGTPGRQRARHAA
jgi:hypothetical protein